MRDHNHLPQKPKPGFQADRLSSSVDDWFFLSPPSAPAGADAYESACSLDFGCKCLSLRVSSRRRVPSLSRLSGYMNRVTRRARTCGSGSALRTGGRTAWRASGSGMRTRTDGPCGMSMLTVNADGHAVMSRMHKPNDDKRSVVILRPDDYDEWLHTKNVEAARGMLQLYPADEMEAASKGE